MGIECRKGKLYYYSKEREGGKVVSRYIGRALDEGPYLIGMCVRGRAMEKRAIRAELREKAKLLREMDEFSKLADVLITGELLISGYHRHKGQWRKKRNGSKKERPLTGAQTRASRARKVEVRKAS